MTVEIGPANLRDASYILGNLRRADREELTRQMPEDADPVIFAGLCLQPGASFIAYDDGFPALIFGFSPGTLAGNVLNAWAFGTRRAARCFRPVAAFVLADLAPSWTADTLIFAWSIAGHTSAHRWLTGLGATVHASLPWGREGAIYHLFAWTPASLGKVKEFAGCK